MRQFKVLLPTWGASCHTAALRAAAMPKVDRPPSPGIKSGAIMRQSRGGKKPGGRAPGSKFRCRAERRRNHQSFAITLMPRTEGIVFGAAMAAPMIIGNGTGFAGSALIVRLFGLSR